MIAVLTRSNQLVSDISSLLGQEHAYGAQTLKPVSHEVVWDAELSAAAAVVLASNIASGPVLEPDLKLVDQPRGC